MARNRTTETALLVYGANAVEGLLRSEQGVQRLHLARERMTPAIVALARDRGVRPEQSDRATLDRLAGTPHHQGAVALAEPYRYAALEDVAAPGCPSALVLDSVQDPRNFGAILRTARAAGVGGVIVPQDRSVGVTSVVATASAGCLFGLVLARVPNVARALGALKDAGFWIVGLVAGGERSLFELTSIERPAIVVGGEGEGIRPLVRRGCDFEAGLPMAPGVESLNVSVATGIALYEMVVRRRLGHA
jgi:23S rRNA (guanosine2251-2'-O)-methyltransferase